MRTVARWPKRAFASRRLVAAAVAVVAAIAAPLAAVATARDWWSQDFWFLKLGNAPTPVTDVNVVRTGTWDGVAWHLVAYGSSTDGICFGITPASSHATGEGGAMGCGRIEGVKSTPESKPYMPHVIAFVASSSERLPAHIYGPVIDSAEEVEVHLGDGEVIRTTTFAVPEELGSIRFYATRLPQAFAPRPGSREPPQLPIRKLVGLDEEGQIVACLIVPMPVKGVPLSACR